MMAETTTQQAAFIVPEWLPEDTEDSVAGIQWHQEAIDALATMLAEAGRRQGRDWGIARGIALLGSGVRYPSGKPYDPKPDVMVLAHALPSGDISGITLADAGPPLFVAEVARRSTGGNDLGIKKEVYEFARAAEYIVFDPAGHVVAPALHAWRLENDAYMPWTSADDGWWHSRALGISFRPDPPFLTIRDRESRPVNLPRRTFERAEQLERKLAEAEQHIAELEDRLRRMGG